MKDTCPKFKVNHVTYLLFFTFFLTGHFKNIILIFLIVIIHELGHVFFLNYFKYKIESIEIFPFGGLTKSYKMLNTPIKHDLIIYFGGILFQFILFLIFHILYYKMFITLNTYNLFIKYNLSILIFNVLPIRPLDGGEIIKLFLEKCYSFKNAQKISNVISFCFLLIFFFINLKFNLNNYVIISFLLFKIYNLIKNERFYLNKFLLERFMYVFPYYKIRNEKVKNVSLLKKETFHYFPDGKKILSEKELLRRKFDINNHF